MHGGPVRTDRAVVPRNDVYADPEGNVHRKTLDGWESRQGNRWVPQQRAEQPVREPVREPSREPVRESGREPAREPVRDVPHDIVREPVREPARQPAREPVGQPAHEPVREPAREPVREAPHASQGGGGLDRDFQARTAGRDRYENSPRPAPPRAPRPVATFPEFPECGPPRGPDR